MLEQAIIDAKALKEAAIKNAESTIVEKYAGEVRQAVEKLLEQDPMEDEEEMGMGDDMGMDDEMGAEEEEPNAAVMGAIPVGHDASAEDVIEIDLDQIMAAAADEPAGEDDDMDREEMADDLGIPELEDEEAALDPGFDEPANRTDEKINHPDELEIDEEELVEIFKESLAVDVPDAALKALGEMEEMEESDDEEEYVDVREMSDELVNHRDGQDPKELEELKTRNSELEEKLEEESETDK